MKKLKWAGFAAVPILFIIIFTSGWVEPADSKPFFISVIIGYIALIIVDVVSAKWGKNKNDR